MRVLVVEDEAMVAMLIEDMLLEAGCDNIEVCNRLGQAIRLLEGADFDLVILDLNLEGELTYPVADILMERGTPFVFATGYGTSMLEGRYAAIPTLQKPFRPEDVERILNDLCGGIGARSTTS
ncbi:response regulator [Rhodoligotrophos defluvii]|uniref:response regulator n=1 Tax=Rhodoligotrophos defluvii TaxID=2561934 RepID=UPI001EF06FEF|nr:response regulator [Rhodoligotrophos defluvii]